VTWRGLEVARDVRSASRVPPRRESPAPPFLVDGNLPGRRGRPGPLRLRSRLRGRAEPARRAPPGDLRLGSPPAPGTRTGSGTRTGARRRAPAGAASRLRPRTHPPQEARPAAAPEEVGGTRVGARRGSQGGRRRGLRRGRGAAGRG